MRIRVSMPERIKIKKSIYPELERRYNDRYRNTDKCGGDRGGRSDRPGRKKTDE